MPVLLDLIWPGLWILHPQQDVSSSQYISGEIVWLMLIWCTCFTERATRSWRHIHKELTNYCCFTSQVLRVQLLSVFAEPTVACIASIVFPGFILFFYCELVSFWNPPIKFFNWRISGGLGLHFYTHFLFQIHLTSICIRHKVVRASLGRQHTIVITADGQSLGFGFNKHGQLGSGNCKEG